ncbi:MAG: biopolymer transporter ExbD [Planctomycetaceae bacterium]
MAIRLRCPNCNAKLSVADRKAGLTVNCPGCKTTVPVPGDPVASAVPVSARGRDDDWDDEPQDDDDAGFQVRRPETEYEGMDLTPMVDVTFLLLIFFMITASFSVSKVLQFPPPDPEKEGAAQTVQKLEDFKEDSIIINVDENNQLIVDEQPLSDPSQLLSTIERIKAAEDKNEIVLVRHYFSSHETTVFVKDVASDAGIQKFRIGIEPGTAPRR